MLMNILKKTNAIICFDENFEKNECNQNFDENVEKQNVIRIFMVFCF